MKKELIKFSYSGKYEFNGIEFSTASDGRIVWCDDWNVVKELEEKGLVARRFYKNLMGHTDYYLKGE